MNNPIEETTLSLLKKLEISEYTKFIDVLIKYLSTDVVRKISKNPIVNDILQPASDTNSDKFLQILESGQLKNLLTREVSESAKNFFLQYFERIEVDLSDQQKDSFINYLNNIPNVFTVDNILELSLRIYNKSINDSKD